MDPDDMYMNEYFLQQLYNSNLKKNFDIIEFSVFNKMKIQIKCVFRTMILKIITKNFQKILFSTRIIWNNILFTWYKYCQ